jgi:hypothetical protein
MVRVMILRSTASSSSVEGGAASWKTAAPGNHWVGFPSDQWPSIRWLTDPTDTLKPMVFDVSDRAWSSHGKGPRIAEFCSDFRRGPR